MNNFYFVMPQAFPGFFLWAARRVFKPLLLRPRLAWGRLAVVAGSVMGGVGCYGSVMFGIGVCSFGYDFVHFC